MASENRFVDDLAKLLSGALGTLQGAKDEATARLRDQLERWLADLDLVAREEFDAVAGMAKAARRENAALEKRIAALETALGTSGAGAQKSAPKRTSAKKPGAGKPADRKKASTRAAKRG